MKPQVNLYCDGSGMTMETPCGFAAILQCGTYKKELSGSLANGTNNVAELMAAVIGFEALKKPCLVTVYSDSEYLIKGFTEGRVWRWSANCWYTKEKGQKIVPNAAIWQRLIIAQGQHEVTWEWVRGHNGHVENERCDELAGIARKSYGWIGKPPVSDSR